MERVKGIEPSYSAWKSAAFQGFTGVLPTKWPKPSQLVLKTNFSSSEVKSHDVTQLSGLFAGARPCASRSPPIIHRTQDLKRTSAAANAPPQPD